jgi:hypothetical protein
MGNTQTNENNSEIENKLLDETAEKTLKSIIENENEKDNERKQLKKRGRDVYNALDEAFIEKKNAENFLRNEIEGEARLNQQIEMKKRSEGVKELKDNYKKVSDAIENAAKPEQKYIKTSNNKRQRTSDGKKRKSKKKSTRKNKKKKLKNNI